MKTRKWSLSELFVVAACGVEEESGIDIVASVENVSDGVGDIELSISRIAIGDQIKTTDTIATALEEFAAQLRKRAL